MISNGALTFMLLQLQPLTLSARVKYLLEKVRKGKHRDQDDTFNEFRTKGHVKLKGVGRRIRNKLQGLSMYLYYMNTCTDLSPPTHYKSLVNWAVITVYVTSSQIIRCTL